MIIFAIVWSSWWILLLLFIINQSLLYFHYISPIFIPLYFIMIGLIFLIIYIFRVTSVSKNISIISPSDGKIIDISDESTTYKQKGLVMLIKCDIFDQWSHVAPVTGEITYVRYINDHNNGLQSLIIKIKGKNTEVHTLHFMIRGLFNKIISGFQYDLYEGQPIYIGDILCIASVNYINWFITSSYYSYVSQAGISVHRGQYIPIYCKPINNNNKNKL